MFRVTHMSHRPGWGRWSPSNAGSGYAEEASVTGLASRRIAKAYVVCRSLSSENNQRVDSRSSAPLGKVDVSDLRKD